MAPAPVALQVRRRGRGAVPAPISDGAGLVALDVADGRVCRLDGAPWHAPAVRIRVLGPLAVTADGRNLAIPGGRQRRLLAALAAHPGAAVPVAVLSELLWGDDQPANPSAALQSQVSRLRRTLGPDVPIRLEGDAYRLEVAADVVDLTRFDALVDRGTAFGAEPADAERHLAAALALWEGEPFDGLADRQAFQVEAVRLVERRHLALQRWAEALLAQGRAAEAVPDLERAAADEPFREPLVGVLMEVLDASGRKAEALRRYEAYRRRLGEELGLEPSPALRALDRRLAADPPDGSGEVEPPAPPTEGPTLEDLVVRYVPSRRHPGLDLAVGTVGDGPTLVAVPAWVTSLAIMAAGRDPRSPLLERLAARHRLVTYDQPGTGLSRGRATELSTEGAVADLEAVVERLGGAPVTVLGVSAGGPAAIAFAARRPDLVGRLVLVGTFADGPRVFHRREVTDAFLTILEASWTTGTQLLAGLFRPGASDDGARRLASVLRDSADVHAGVGYLRAAYDADVGALLSEVRCPALVLHYRGDLVIPFEGGEQLAAGLADVRFVPMDGRYHLPDLADVDRMVRTIERFEAEAPAPR